MLIDAGNVKQVHRKASKEIDRNQYRYNKVTNKRDSDECFYMYFYIDNLMYIIFFYM